MSTGSASSSPAHDGILEDAVLRLMPRTCVQAHRASCYWGGSGSLEGGRVPSLKTLGTMSSIDRAYANEVAIGICDHKSSTEHVIVWLLDHRDAFG